MRAPAHCTKYKPRLLHAQTRADPSCPTLTLWWYQDFAVDGTPANRVNIHCAQIAPEVMAGVILKALVSQKSPVPCQDRANNQTKALEAKNFSSSCWAPQAYPLQHGLQSSALVIRASPTTLEPELPLQRAQQPEEEPNTGFLPPLYHGISCSKISQQLQSS